MCGKDQRAVVEKREQEGLRRLWERERPCAGPQRLEGICVKKKEKDRNSWKEQKILHRTQRKQLKAVKM